MMRINLQIGNTDILGTGFNNSFRGAQNMTEYTQEFQHLM